MEQQKEKWAQPFQVSLFCPAVTNANKLDYIAVNIFALVA